ncbi:MAG: hypothetical protein WD873_04155 [Candidatus Hydrogenedentales bacterium]
MLRTGVLAPFIIAAAAPAWAVQLSAAPTVAAQHDAGTPWADVDDALSDDGANATASLSTTDQSTQTLTLRGFGFALPADAVVTGLEVSVEISADGLSGTTGPLLLQAHFTKVGEFSSFPQVVAGIDPAGGATFGPAVVVAGSESDLWSASWTPAELNNPDFALELRWDKAGPDAAGSIHIDYATVSVTFVTPSGDVGVITASRPAPYIEGEELTLFAPPGADYQWAKDGELMAGATAASLDLAPLETGHSGSYSVIFTAEAKELVAAPPFALVVIPAAEAMPAGEWGALALAMMAVGVLWIALRRAFS